MGNDKTIKEMMDAFNRQPLTYMSLKDAAAMDSAVLAQVPEDQKLSWLGIDDLKSMLDYAKEQQAELIPQSSTVWHDYWFHVMCKTEEELTKKITEIFPFES